MKEEIQKTATSLFEKFMMYLIPETKIPVGTKQLFQAEKQQLQLSIIILFLFYNIFDFITHKNLFHGFSVVKNSFKTLNWFD